MMEQTWTTKQVVTFMMAMATGLHFVAAGLNQEKSFHTIDQLLESCIQDPVALHIEEQHLEAFQESLQPGFFAEPKSVIDAKLSSQDFHQDVMQLSDDSVITLVANLSNSTQEKLKIRTPFKHVPNKGL